MAARALKIDKSDGKPALRTFRVDLASGLGKMRLLGDGSLAIPARIARAGVLEYTDNGKTTSEYRDPAEVFSQESLDSFKGVTVTLDHPADGVDPSNWASLSTGHVGDDVRRDGMYVAATVYVKRQDGIEAVKSGDALECSGGYFCTTVEEAGVSFDGVPYTHRQTQVRGNHVALGPKDWGRSGNNVRMYLDAREPTKKDTGDTMDEATKKAVLELLAQLGKLITGAVAPAGEAPSPDPAADAKKGDETPAPAGEKKDDPAAEEQKKADARAAAQADAARADQSRTDEQARIERLVQDSADIRTRAALLGVTSLAGKSNMAIMLEAIKLARPTCDSADMAKRGEVYVRAYFDAIDAKTDSAPKTIASSDAELDALFGRLAGSPSAPKQDSAGSPPAEETAASARDGMLKRQQERNKAYT